MLLQLCTSAASRCRESLARKGERVQGEMPSLCVALVLSLAVSAGCAGVAASGADAPATADAETVAAPDHRGLRAHTTTRSIRGGSRSHDAIDVDEELLRLPEWLQLAPFLPTTTSTMLADDGAPISLPLLPLILLIINNIINFMSKKHPKKGCSN